MLSEPVYKNGFDSAAGGRMQDAGDRLLVGGGVLDALLLSRFDAMSDEDQAVFMSYLDLMLAEKKLNLCAVAATMSPALPG
jgi:hypothetical protein